MIEFFKKFTRKNFVYYSLVSLKKIGVLVKWSVIFSPIILSALQLFTSVLPTLYPPKPIDTGLKTILAIMFWVAIMQFIAILGYGYFKIDKLSSKIDKKIEEVK